MLSAIVASTWALGEERVDLVGDELGDRERHPVHEDERGYAAERFGVAGGDGARYGVAQGAHDPHDHGEGEGEHGPEQGDEEGGSGPAQVEREPVDEELHGGIRP